MYCFVIAVAHGGVTGPEPVDGGTANTTLVGFAEETTAWLIFNFTRLFSNKGSKPVPLIVTESPGPAITGLTFVITGPVAATVNDEALVADPVGLVTLIGPLVAPAGTVATSFVDDADVTVADVPLNRTVFCDGVALKPVPKIETDDPTGAAFGVNSKIETIDAL